MVTPGVQLRLHPRQLVQNAVGSDFEVELELFFNTCYPAKEDALFVLFHHDPGLAQEKIAVIRIFYGSETGLHLVRHQAAECTRRLVFQFHFWFSEDAVCFFSFNRISVGVIDKHFFGPVEAGCLCTQ